MKRLTYCMVLALAAWAVPLWAADAPLEKFRPQWQVGQQWMVETQSRQQQSALPEQQSITARWQFTVEAVEPLGGRPCWRIGIHLVENGRRLAEPKTTLWIDQATAAIRQIETQLPTPQGYKRATESFQSETGPAPVVGLQSVLPIALPQYPEAGVKAIDAFEYETVSGPGGIKAVGELGFATRVSQELVRPSDEGLKSIFEDPELKALGDDPLIEVRLSTPEQTVRQIWRQAAPWPEFSDNGTTKARLIHVAADLRDAGSRAPGIRIPPTAARWRDLPENDSRDPVATDDGIKTLVVSGGSEKATAKTIPWSGYWWPMRDGRLLVVWASTTG
jgi:hypothetical protein